MHSNGVRLTYNILLSKDNLPSSGSSSVTVWQVMEPAGKISLMFSLQVVFSCNENKSRKILIHVKTTGF